MKQIKVLRERERNKLGKRSNLILDPVKAPFLQCVLYIQMNDNIMTVYKKQVVCFFVEIN